MKSRTKNRLDVNTVVGLASKHFPDAAVTEVRELTGGAFNAAYLVYGSGRLTGGAVLKIGPSEGTKTLTYEKDILRAEVQVYKLLENKGLPVPRVLAYDYSGSELPCDYFFMTFVEGVVWNKAEKKRMKSCEAELKRELGRIFAAIHSVTGDKFGYIKEDSRFKFDTWAEAFAAMMDDILNDGRAGNRKLPYDKILRAVKEHTVELNEVRTPRLVDFDLWAGNVLLKETDTGYRISGVIDFERAFFGDPYADFAASSLQFLLGKREKEKYVGDGYESVSGTPILSGRSEKVRMDLYKLYLAVIMNVETYRYGRLFAGVMTSFSRIMIKKQLKKLL